MSRLCVLSIAGAACLLCGCARLAVNQTGLAYYVAADGNDADSGARGAPFATLERAREAVRAVVRTGVLPVGGVTVCVRAGRYYRTTGFVLSAADSGMAGRPVVYRAFPGEHVRLVGGRELPPGAFHTYRSGSAAPGTVAYGGPIQCADLRAMGFADSVLLQDGGDTVPGSEELFFGKVRLQRIESPNHEPEARGTWCVNRETGMLYVWPPAPLTAAPLVLATLTDPLVTLEQTAFVSWQGFTMENTRGVAVAVQGGHSNRVVACAVRNTGHTGIAVSGVQNGVSGCDLEGIGGSAISLDGGDRPSLRAAGNYADNNYIRGGARSGPSGAAAISVSGVGQRVTHNLIHDVPQAAIAYAGNDHLIEANEIMRACLEASATGALYTGRDWGSQGNLIRGNFIHHIGSANRQAAGVCLDDCASGNTIEKNVFYRAGSAVVIGGGRYNQVLNNVFVDCSPAVRLDDHGRQCIRWQAGPQESWDLQAKLEAMNYRQPPWSTRYPHLVSILDDQADVPLHNTVARNLCVGGPWLEASGDTGALLDLHGNLETATDPGFVNVRSLDLRLRAASPVWTAVPGFEPIPLRTAGVYRDALRASWPVGRPACRGGLAAAARPLAPAK